VGLSDVLVPASSVATLPAVDVKSLHQDGELTLENDFKGALTKAELLERKAMINREQILRSQASEVLRVKPVAVFTTCTRYRKLTLRSCDVLDRLHLESPSRGSRMLRGLLAAGGARSAVAREIADAADGDEALFAVPHGSGTGHKISRICARMEITRPTRCGDGHHLHPMERGLRHLAWCSSWFSRRVLSWRLSITDGKRPSASRRWRTLGSSRQADISIPDQAAVHRRGLHRAFSPTTKLRSAWTAKGLGATTYSSAPDGAASNMRRYLRAYEKR